MNGRGLRVERKPIEPRPAQSFVLPMPPSPVGAFEHFEKWRDAARKALKAQRPRRLLGLADISIVLGRSARRSRLETLIAPVLQLLVECEVIPASDNSVVRKVSAAWDDVEACKIIIEAAP